MTATTLSPKILAEIDAMGTQTKEAHQAALMALIASNPDEGFLIHDVHKCEYPKKGEEFVPSGRSAESCYKEIAAARTALPEATVTQSSFFGLTWSPTNSLVNADRLDSPLEGNGIAFSLRGGKLVKAFSLVPAKVGIDLQYSQRATPASFRSQTVDSFLHEGALGLFASPYFETTSFPLLSRVRLGVLGQLNVGYLHSDPVREVDNCLDSGNSGGCVESVKQQSGGIDTEPYTKVQLDNLGFGFDAGGFLELGLGPVSLEAALKFRKLHFFNPSGAGNVLSMSGAVLTLGANFAW